MAPILQTAYLRLGLVFLAFLLGLLAAFWSRRRVLDLVLPFLPERLGLGWGSAASEMAAALDFFLRGLGVVTARSSSDGRTANCRRRCWRSMRSSSTWTRWPILKTRP